MNNIGAKRIFGVTVSVVIIVACLFGLVFRSVAEQTITIDASSIWDNLRPNDVGDFGHGMVYSPNSKQITIFGGQSGKTQAEAKPSNLVQEIYMTAPCSIASVNVTGNKPSARSGHVFVWCGPLDGIVLYGGKEGDHVCSDMWLFRDGVWKPLSVATPPARHGAAAIWIPDKQVVVMYGGCDADGHIMDEVWTFDGSAWKNVTPSDD